MNSSIHIEYYRKLLQHFISIVMCILLLSLTPITGEKEPFVNIF